MTENKFDLTSTDGTHLAGITWTNDTAPQAIMAIVHGHGEHKGRYAHVAEFFLSKGFHVYAFDQRGHGESGGNRGHCSRYDLFLDDVEQFLMKIRSQHTDLPIVLYGHSMGGNIATNFLLRRKVNEIAAAIITDPLFKIAFEPPKWKVVLGNLMSNVWPSLAQPTGLDALHLSTDKAVAEAYKKDPLVHDKMSAKLFVDIFEAADWALAHAVDLKTPTLMMHGEADQITSPEGSKIFAKNNPAQVTLKTWKGMYHEIHNEVDQQAVLDYEWEWLQQMKLF